MWYRVGIVLVVLFTASSLGAATVVEVNGRVVDVQGKAVSGARVSAFWFAEQGAPLEPDHPAVTDPEGRFTVDVSLYRRDAVVMAVDSAGKCGGLAVIPAGGPEGPVRIALEPLGEVKARFTCDESGQSPGETYTTVFLMPGRLRVAAARSRESRFALKLPPGAYELRGNGNYRHVAATRDLTLAPGQVLDLGPFDLKLTALARLAGKEPPPWHVTGARGVPQSVHPSDFKGKWVVIDFWGYWCGPCVARSLPGWMDFAEDHAADRDKFVILAFHDPKATDFASLDERLKPIIRRPWRGRSLPFPILLDTKGTTVEAYGIEHWPTVVLLDPEGRVVDVPQDISHHVEDFLAEQLTPLPAEKRIARALDRDLSLATDDAQTLAELIDFYNKVGRIRIRLDPDELKAAGIDEAVRVPLTLGGRLTLRAWLNLTLEPFDLTYVADGAGLRVVRRTSENESLAPPSPRQEQDNAVVSEALAARVSFDFRNQTLAQIVAALEEKTGLTFVVDPAGRRSGAINSKTTVTGSAGDEPLGPALARVLGSLGMRYAVRNEAVVLTTAPRSLAPRWLNHPKH